MGVYELTAPASYPDITFPNYTEPGASTVLKVTLLMLSTILFAGKKKRSVPVSIHSDTESQVLYKVLSDLDQDDCIATAICFVASKENRTDEEDRLLSVVGNNPQIPVFWSDIHKIEAKFMYAGFVGSKSTNDSVSECRNIFKKCQVPPHHIVNMLTNGDTACGEGLPILSRPIVRNQKEIKIRGSPSLDGASPRPSHTLSFFRPSTKLIVKERSSVKGAKRSNIINQ